jgi:hypothetical protein
MRAHAAWPGGAVAAEPEDHRADYADLAPAYVGVVGEELINLYNDTYRPILGGKHPWALGQPAKQVWREIWAR